MQCGCNCGNGKITTYANHMLSLHSGTPITKKTAGPNGRVTCSNPKLTLLGCIQSQLLINAISQAENHRESGFFTRFDYFTSKYKRYTNSERAQAQISFEHKGFPEPINLLLHVKRLCGEKENVIFELDDASHTIYNDWDDNLTNYINSELTSDLDQEYRNILQKKDTNPLVFAMLVWLMESSLQNSHPDAFIIRARHMRAGISIAKYLEDQHFELIKLCVNKNQITSTKETEVIKFILKNCDSLTYRQLHRSQGMTEALIRTGIATLKQHEVGDTKYVYQKGKYFFINHHLSKTARDFLSSIGYNSQVTSGDLSDPSEDTMPQPIQEVDEEVVPEVAPNVIDFDDLFAFLQPQ
jgi:hypothetical protein